MIGLSWKNIKSTDSIVKVNRLLKFMAANGTYSNTGDSLYPDENSNRSNFTAGFSQEYYIPLEDIERKGRGVMLRELNTNARNVIIKASTYLKGSDFPYIHNINRLWPVENLRESDNKYTIMIMLNFENVPEILYTMSEDDISDLPPDFNETDMAVVDSFSNSIDMVLSYIHGVFTEELDRAVSDAVTSTLKFKRNR